MPLAAPASPSATTGRTAPSRARRAILHSNGSHQRHYCIDPVIGKTTYAYAQLTAEAVHQLGADFQLEELDFRSVAPRCRTRCCVIWSALPGPNRSSLAPSGLHHAVRTARPRQLKSKPWIQITRCGSADCRRGHAQPINSNKWAAPASHGTISHHPQRSTPAGQRYG